MMNSLIIHCVPSNKLIIDTGTFDNYIPELTLLTPDSYFVYKTVISECGIKNLKGQIKYKLKIIEDQKS